jgi:beta-glucosidase
VRLWIGGGQPLARPGLAAPAGVEARFVVEGGRTAAD